MNGGWGVSGYLVSLHQAHPSKSVEGDNMVCCGGVDGEVLVRIAEI